MEQVVGRLIAIEEAVICLYRRSLVWHLELGGRLLDLKPAYPRLHRTQPDRRDDTRMVSLLLVALIFHRDGRSKAMGADLPLITLVGLVHHQGFCR